MKLFTPSARTSVVTELGPPFLVIGLALVLAMAFHLFPVASTDGRQVRVPASAKEVPGPIPGTVMTKEYVAAVGRVAYLWGWPLVNMHNRREFFVQAPKAGLLGGVLPVAPVGQIAMLSDYIKPDQCFVAAPNQDVVYGVGFLSLDEQPVVMQVPDFGDRFWVYQIVDQRTDSFARVGKQYQTMPGMYLLVGPNWQGEKPVEIEAVFRSLTDLGAIVPRIFMDDTPEDRAAIQPLINQVMVYPLSEYTGKMKSTEWKKLPTLLKPGGHGEGQTQWVVPETFFDLLPTVMQEVPPLPGEEALYALIKSVLDAAAKNPELKAVFKETAQAADVELTQPLFEFRNNGVPVGNSWNTLKNAARFGTDYVQRTATAKGNMFSNVPEETVYLGTDFDAKEERLNGAKAYTVTFRKGQLPPVNGFWSLTLYNEKHFFHPNALNRYSLGTKNKTLQVNADGALTIYVQAESPGEDRESNWLPAPKENFSLYIRAYWPQADIIKGQWTPPPVLKGQ